MGIYVSSAVARRRLITVALLNTNTKNRLMLQSENELWGYQQTSVDLMAPRVYLEELIANDAWDHCKMFPANQAPPSVKPETGEKQRKIVASSGHVKVLGYSTRCSAHLDIPFSRFSFLPSPRVPPPLRQL
uniref:Uncharacterized protein n=1 Tax=Timema poppense TaxID=170557 RepID=A0A7R9D138_TIMPO|nr:unnamed protein product [Timema poppensis]